MIGVALVSFLTGVAEEHEGIVAHVELVRAEHPAPPGHTDWQDVVPSHATGPHYFWDPSGWVVVQRNDGTMVRARNGFSRARYDTRVTVVKKWDDEWMVSGVD